MTTKQNIAQTGGKSLKVQLFKQLKIHIVRGKEYVDVWTEKIASQSIKNTNSVQQDINHKWALSLSTVVEDAIYRHAKDFKVEQLVSNYLF